MRLHRLFGMMAAVGLLAISAQAWGALLVSAEFQGTAGTGLGRASTTQSGNEASAVALNPAFSGGAKWNQLEITQYNGANTTNPSFSGLADRNTGSATSVGFSLTGITQAFNDVSGGATNAVTDDTWFFISGLGHSTEFNWQISGLTPGVAYKLVLYGGSNPVDLTRYVDQKVDTNGNGLLTDETAVRVGTVASDCKLFSVVAGSTGLVLGHGSVSTAEANWTGFQITQVVPEPGTLTILAAGLVALIAYAWRKRK